MSGFADILLFGSVYLVEDVIRGDYAGALRAFPFAIPGFALVGALIYGYIKHPLEYIKGTMGIATGLLLIAFMWYFILTFTGINAFIRVIIAVPVFFWVLSLIGKVFFGEGGDPPNPPKE
ncbi:MAG TPA: hypothetical protein VMV35_06940 [Halothiobacillus sp.]|nr:hypothetical protein [Halothiobacillus sp.]